VRTGRKKFGRRVLLIIGIAVVVMPALFVPYTPKNAVRLCILENGHPISAVFAFPMKMTKEDSTGYSGKNVLAYYHILIPFNISLGGMQAHTLGVHKLDNGGKTYTAFPAADVGP